MYSVYEYLSATYSVGNAQTTLTLYKIHVNKQIYIHQLCIFIWVKRSKL